MKTLIIFVLILMSTSAYSKELKVVYNKKGIAVWELTDKEVKELGKMEIRDLSEAREIKKKLKTERVADKVSLENIRYDSKEERYEAVVSYIYFYFSEYIDKTRNIDEAFYIPGKKMIYVEYDKNMNEKEIDYLGEKKYYKDYEIDGYYLNQNETKNSKNKNVRLSDVFKYKNKVIYLAKISDEYRIYYDKEKYFNGKEVFTPMILSEESGYLIGYNRGDSKKVSRFSIMNLKNISVEDVVECKNQLCELVIFADKGESFIYTTDEEDIGLKLVKINIGTKKIKNTEMKNNFLEDEFYGKSIKLKEITGMNEQDKKELLRHILSI